MEDLGQEQDPIATSAHVLPRTTPFTFPPIQHDQDHDPDFYSRGLDELGIADPELARQLVATAERWAEETTPDGDPALRERVRSHYIGMGVFTYKALRRQGLADQLRSIFEGTPEEAHEAMRPHLDISDETA